MKKTDERAIILNFSSGLVDILLSPGEGLDVRELPTEERVVVSRGEKGIPIIKAESLEGGYFGLGYMHGYDRAFEMWFTKILVEGRVAEHFGDREELINIDKYFRRLKLYKPIEGEEADITRDKLKLMHSYLAGIEYFRRENDIPLEFKITGVKQLSRWELKDCIAFLRLMSYVGLAEGQGSAELILTEAVMRGKKYFDALSEAFNPYFEGYDYNWFKGIKLEHPLVEGFGTKSDNSNNSSTLSGMGGSNNWAVNGEWTENASAIFCNDPHLEISRLPSIWYEVIIDTPQMWCQGITVPGAPGIPAGWNGKLSWGITFTAADTEDFFIEACKNGSYLRDDKWFQFRERRELIKTKAGRIITYNVYENDHGFLMGDPNIEGRYLARKWSGYEPVAGRVLNAFLEIPMLSNVKDALNNAEKMVIPSLNWLFADSDGNIGFKMTGTIPKRKKGLSGILPIPGWDSSYGWDGYLSPDELPVVYNPKEGYIVTANNRLDKEYGSFIQNMPFSEDRALRIGELIEELKPLNPEKMKKIQMDVYSKQAKRIVKFVSRYLEGDSIGERLLAWDYNFTPESVEATIFDDFYRELVIETVGEVLFPKDLLVKIYDETLFFLLNHHVIEREWLKGQDGLFAGTDWESVVKRVLEKLKAKEYVNWGKKNSIVMKHLLFGDTILGRLGFNEKKHPLRGYKTTIHQGTKYREGKRDMTFGPSYRLIVDMKAKIAYSIIPGGVSGRRFSRYYKSEINDWLSGNYKSITFGGRLKDEK